MTNQRTKYLRSFTQLNDVASILGYLEHEMPLLVAIAQEISQPEADLIKLFPAARQLLGEALHAIDRQHEVRPLEVA